MTFNPEIVDPRKEAVNVTLPVSLREWVDQRAAEETEGNRSMALARMLRKLARYEAAEAEGSLVVKKIK